MLKIKVLVIAISVFLLSSIQTKAQQKIEIPNIDTLKNYLHNYYLKKQSAEQLEYRTRYKYKLLAWLPSVGFTFGMPSISWGSGNAMTYLNRTQIEKAKVNSIARVNEVQYNNDLAKINADHETLRRRCTLYQQQYDVLEVERKIFEIAKNGYDNKEIVPTEYLQKSLKFQQAENNLNILFFELCALKNQILANARVIKWEAL